LYDKEQLVQVTWNNYSKKWYTDRGYIFTHKNDSFTVKAKDLPKGSAVRIIATCDYCGREYETQNDILMHGREIIQKDCCPNCTGKKASDVSRVNRARRYFKKLRGVCDQYGYELLTGEEEYTDLHMMVRYRCPKHGIKEAMFDNLMRGHKCLDCSYEERFDGMRHDREYVEAVINHINGNTLLNPGEYQNAAKRNLRIRCRCGNEYTTSLNNFLKHNVTQCYSCSCKESSGEAIVRAYLDNNQIEYTTQKRFTDCRDKKPLPFDFFLPDYNTCIEFDGKQHFEECEGFTDFETVQRHDRIKTQYCEDHNIKLIRIPYYDGHHISEILKQNITT